MKNNYEKQLHYAINYWLKLLIMAKLCILFLICSLTTVAAESAYSGPTGSAITSIVAGGTTNMQQDIVKGTVKDAVTGEALIGVTVMIKGTTVGTITDINGQFSLKLPQKESLVSVSFIGYTTQELMMQQASTVTVSMQLEITQIQEVVVVGYGTQKKESVVGAISQTNAFW